MSAAPILCWKPSQLLNRAIFGGVPQFSGCPWWILVGMHLKLMMEETEIDLAVRVDLH